MRELAHVQVEAQQFLHDYQSAFTTRADGSTWSKWEQTWAHAAHYFRGLIRPGSSTVTDIADQLHTDQEQLERFVRESAWSDRSGDRRIPLRVNVESTIWPLLTRDELVSHRTWFQTSEVVAFSTHVLSTVEEFNGVGCSILY